MPDKVVAPSRPDCCICARSTAVQRGARCAHVEVHRYCDEHRARIDSFDIRPMCAGVARNTYLDEAQTQNARCANPAIKGAEKCKRHGAANPNVRRAATRRVRQAQAIAQIEVIRQQRGLGRDVSAIKLIQLCLDESAFWVCEWRDEVHRLSEGQPGRLVGANHLGDQAVDIAYLCLVEAMKTAAHFSKLALDAGLQERQQKLREAEFGLITDIWLKLAAEFNIPESDARPAIARHLRSA